MAKQPPKPDSSIWPIIILVASLFAGLIAILVVMLNPFDLDSSNIIDIHDNALWSRIRSAPIFSSPIFTPANKTTVTDYESRARSVLRQTPLIDGHNDFPFLLRSQLRNQIDQYDFANLSLASHTDLFKLKEGMMGGQFWSVWVPCPGDLDVVGEQSKKEPGLNEPNWAVRDTLEQIDITKRFVAAYPGQLQFCTDPTCVRKAHKAGKIASMLGIEGGHQTGNSLGVLRLMFENGARYMTLTHNCDNTFATAWTGVDTEQPRDSREADKGLTSFGKELVLEMNRLGMLVDLSHVSANTMRDVLDIARAPVIFSHSGAYAVQNHGRNVPDDVLLRLSDNGGVVMVPAVSPFLNVEHPEEATIEDVVDQIFHVASVAGWEHVGIGSDFDGTVLVPKGLENTSKFPDLIALVLERGATDKQAKMLVGDNLLRAWHEAERVAKASSASGEKPRDAYWEDREWEESEWSSLVPRLFE